MKTFEGSLVASNIKVAIVAARFNEFITSKLIGGAMDGLSRHGVQEADIHLAWVPGAFEIPLVAAKLANSGKYDAVICLGAVIRGSTRKSPTGMPIVFRASISSLTCMVPMVAA